MLKEVKIGPLKISAITKAEFLTVINERIKSNQQTWVTTPYSEFLYAALRSGEARDLLAKADIAIADGVGILWAERFLSRPLTAKSHFGKILQSWGQVVITGARILLTPKYLYARIPEKIVGASVFFAMCEQAAKNGHSIFLLNDWSDSARKTAELLKQLYLNLKIAGVSEKRKDDESVVQDIQAANPDIIFVGYGPIKQERWINQHLKALPVKVAMGVGGTFDYAAGNKLRPPAWVRDIGLEWLFRLVTQPRRLPRIYRATYGLVLSMVRYKVFSSYPFRNNAVAVAVNRENKILLCKRVANFRGAGTKESQHNYWQFPQGGLDENEDIIPGAARELQEETGIVTVEPLGVAEFEHSYEWLNGGRAVLFNSRIYKGQEQQTVFFRFTGPDEEIKVDGIEFEDYAWLTPGEVLDRIAPERRHHAAAVLGELQALLEKSA